MRNILASVLLCGAIASCSILDAVDSPKEAIYIAAEMGEQMTNQIGRAYVAGDISYEKKESLVMRLRYAYSELDLAKELLLECSTCPNPHVGDARDALLMIEAILRVRDE